MKKENRYLSCFFIISGGLALFTIFSYLTQIILDKDAGFNVHCILVMELLCFLSITVLLCEHKPVDSSMLFLILYLFFSSLTLLIPFDFLLYTERFYRITIGLISFLFWLNALLFYFFHGNDS